MAPLFDERISRKEDIGYKFDAIRRDGSASGGNYGTTVDAPGSSGASAMSNTSVYLGLGLGVGGAILIAVVVVVVQIVVKRKQHNRMMEALEVEEAVQVARIEEVGEVPRPANPVGCSTLAPIQARAGWGALASDEAIHEPEPVAQVNRRKRMSVSLPKRLKQKGVALRRPKRLTAIIESLRSRSTNSPVIADPDALPNQPDIEKGVTAPGNPKAYTLRKVEEEDVFVCPGSPKANAFPYFAIRPLEEHKNDVASRQHLKATRSKSVGALVAPLPQNVVLGQISRMSQPNLHSRSISLGAPPSRPPSGPVPPLPVILPHAARNERSSRQGLRASRMSVSSQESPGSSVLVTSPVLKLHEQDKAVSSPSLEQLVAEDDSASLKTVATKQWQKPLVAGPGLRGNDREGVKSHASIRSNIARYSSDSLLQHRLSSVSAASSNSSRCRVSIIHTGQADQISISRVSAENSLNSYCSVRKVTTPRKGTRTSVSAYGSPAERKKTGILRDISGNSLGPSRQPSNATQDSSRSSNGNPFQWDQPLEKPSALKGSPNARKGHKRQNCVRISTLTPQVLGPPPSRPTSPNIMHGIEEKSGDGDEPTNTNELRFVSNQRPSRPTSASFSAPSLRVRTLRASLTPSSPTLSAWTAFQENGLPSQPSDSQLSISQYSTSPPNRAGSRQSDRSSAFSIPSFPSPVKATVSNVQLSRPVPEFYLSRPSTDIAEDESSSPFALNFSSDLDMPSSPPLPVSKHEEYDPAHPAWPMVNIPAPQNQEYDPASPTWDITEPERSSPFLPFAANATTTARHSEEVSPRSRPTSYGGHLPDTPPCSPKTMPEGFQAFFDRQDSDSKPARASEKLTSANASAIMARMPSKPVDFPGAPILPPPEQPEGYSKTTPSRSPQTSRQRAVSNVAYLQPMRPAPPPPLQDADMPSPLQISNKTSPRGPRTQPAHSVLKNAMALRRMNSEVNDFLQQHRESRRYQRLGREASPLVPWIGSPDPNDGCGDMNELFDFGFASAGVEDEHTSALDEIDMTEVERKLDGALAGFEAIPSDDAMPRQDRSSSVWEDGEKFWEQEQSSPSIGVAKSSPLPMPDINTPKKVQGLTITSPRSIQHTPKSLYDSDGFLKT